MAVAPISLSEIAKQIAEMGNTFTPELFAWKLLLDDTNNNDLLNQLDTNNEDNEDDKLTLEFEILTTIFMELLYNIIYLEQEQNQGLINKYKLTFDKLTKIIEIIINKFQKCGINIEVSTIENINANKNNIIEILNGRYCNVILRNNECDNGLFILYANKIDPNKCYHFVLNKNRPEINDLDDLYMTCQIDNIIYKINFNKITIHNNP